jgi:hypothetical protein
MQQELLHTDLLAELMGQSLPIRFYALFILSAVGQKPTNGPRPKSTFVRFGPILLQKSAIREQSERSDLLVPLLGICSGGAAVLRLLD